MLLQWHTKDTKDPTQELISECTVYSSQNNSNEVTTGKDLRAELFSANSKIKTNKLVGCNMLRHFSAIVCASYDKMTKF